MNDNNWHLRIGVTSSCNFRCVYCNPYGLHDSRPNVSYEDLCNLISAAVVNGISRIHWTGGEPTTRKDILALMEYAKSHGITQQIITTNGKTLYSNIEDFIEAGLTRVIVSIDSLEKERFANLTGIDCLDNVLRTIEESVKHLSTLTKLSVVTMKSTLPELGSFLNYIYTMNHKGYIGKLAMKLNQFFPCNPHQLNEEGSNYWAREFVTREEILETLSSLSDMYPIPRKAIEGDNPTYDYFWLEKYDVMIGVLTLFSLNYPCGRCHKLRVQPSGNLSICLQQDETYSFIGKTQSEMVELIASLFKIRSDLDNNKPMRQHYRAQLGELRFGKVNEAKSIDYFKEKLIKHNTDDRH